jgi:hypothetical protein
VLWQVRSNGWVSAEYGAGWQVTTGGMTVLASGLTVLAGGVMMQGSLVGTSGTLSLASPHAQSGVDVYASVTSFTGNAIIGRTQFGTTSTALRMMEGANTLFDVCRLSCTVCAYCTAKTLCSDSSGALFCPAPVLFLLRAMALALSFLEVISCA